MSPLCRTLHGCPEELTSALSKADSGRPLTLVYTTDLCDSSLLEHLSATVPVVFLGSFRGEMFLGPLWSKGTTVCIACLQYRLRATHTSEHASSPLFPEGAIHLIRSLLDDKLREYDETGNIVSLATSLVSIESKTLKQRRHVIVPLRTCSVCPPGTSANLRAYCSPWTGIVTRLLHTRNKVAGVYHASCSCIAPPTFADANRKISGLNSAWGRGLSLPEAETTCLGEALETYSLAHRGDEPIVSARLSDINGIDPRDLLMVSSLQYEGRKDVPTTSIRRRIPEPFDSRRAIDWLCGTELSQEQTVWVPAACCLTAYHYPLGEPHFAHADSNACASGSTWEQATLAALLEAAERDALAIWWYNRVQRPQVELSSLEDDTVLQVQHEFRKLGRRLTILDLTNDLAIPTYVGISAEMDGSKPVIASAAHISARTAILRTVTESALNWFATSRFSCDSETTFWLATACLEQHPYLLPCDLVSLPPEPEQQNEASRISSVIQRLKIVGLRPVAVDLTRCDTTLRTVRVLVPGLRDFKARFAAGRLFDVPVKLGWISQARLENELNPWSAF